MFLYPLGNGHDLDFFRRYRFVCFFGVWRYPHIIPNSTHHRFSPAKIAVETGPTSCVRASAEERGLVYPQALGGVFSSQYVVIISINRLDYSIPREFIFGAEVDITIL